MSRPLFDVLAAAVAACSLTFAVRRPEKAAPLCALGAIAIGLAMSLDPWLHAWDERYHALVGWNLTKHPLVPTLWDEAPLPLRNDWGQIHVWIHKPPLPLYLIALSLKLFGKHELAVRLPSVLLLGLCAFATVHIGRELLGDRTAAALGGVLVALNGALLAIASGRIPTDHADSVFVSMICVSIWAALVHVRKGGAGRAALTGALVGLAILSKWLPALLVFPVWWLALPRPRPWRDVALALAVCVAVAAPWQIYVSHAFPAETAWETHDRVQHLYVGLDKHVGSIFFHVARIPRFFGEASPLALLWFFVRRRSAPLLAWIALPYAFFSFVATKMDMYVMPAAPAIALIVAAACVAFWRTRRPIARVLAVLLVALPVRYLVLEQWKPLRTPTEPWVASLKALPRGPRVLVVGARHPVEAMFYAGVTAYEEMPPESELQRLQREGWQIVRGAP